MPELQGLLSAFVTDVEKTRDVGEFVEIHTGMDCAKTSALMATIHMIYGPGREVCVANDSMLLALGIWLQHRATVKQ